MNALGTHLLLELRECNPKLLNDLPYIQSALLQAAQEVGATIVGHSFHQFDPYGVTGIVAIAESHLSIHTWPEYGYAAADIFTCGASFNPYQAAQLILERLEAKSSQLIEIKRGMLAQRGALLGSKGGGAYP